MGDSDSDPIKYEHQRCAIVIVIRLSMKTSSESDQIKYEDQRCSVIMVFLYWKLLAACYDGFFVLGMVSCSQSVN